MACGVGAGFWAVGVAAAGGRARGGGPAVGGGADRLAAGGSGVRVAGFPVDADLLDFVRSRDFRHLERETKRNYATDIRLLLTFLSSRGVGWRAATERDLGDYRVWRCRAPQNPVRVGGSKWNREAAAFTKLFRWAGVLPLPVDASRAEDRAADSVGARVSWLTPRTWRLWSDIGLRGHDRDGTRRGAGTPGRRRAILRSCS